MLIQTEINFQEKVNVFTFSLNEKIYILVVTTENFVYCIEMHTNILTLLFTEPSFSFYCCVFFFFLLSVKRYFSPNHISFVIFRIWLYFSCNAYIINCYLHFQFIQRIHCWWTFVKSMIVKWTCSMVDMDGIKFQISKIQSHRECPRVCHPMYCTVYI